MTQSRLLLLALIVLGLLFALGIGLGATNQEKPPDTDNEDAMKKYADKFSSTSWSKLLTDALSPIIPKLQPAEVSIGNSMTPLTQTRFPQMNRDSSLILTVLPISEEAYIPVRQAVLVRKSGVVQITFTSSNAENESLRKQELKSTPIWREEKFTIPKEGGTFTLTCGDNTPCQVELKKS